jgi:hypothetical protein
MIYFSFHYAFMSLIWSKLQTDSLLIFFIRLSCALLMVWLRKAHSVLLMATILFQSMTRYPCICSLLLVLSCLYNCPHLFIYIRCLQVEKGLKKITLCSHGMCDILECAIELLKIV